MGHAVTPESATSNKHLVQPDTHFFTESFNFWQITGGYKNVQNALSEVVGRLRHNLKSGEALNGARQRSPLGRVGETAPHKLHQSVALSPYFEQETIAIQGVDQFVLPLNRSQMLQVKVCALLCIFAVYLLRSFFFKEMFSKMRKRC